MAFQFTGLDLTTFSYGVKNDPNFVKMIVSLKGADKDGERYEKTIQHHECTEEEYAEFYPIVASQETHLEGGKYESF